MMSSVIQPLEDVIWQRSLMKNDTGDFLIIIGNDKKGDSDWEQYLSIFEWRNDRLEKIEGLEHRQNNVFLLRARIRSSKNATRNDHGGRFRHAILAG